MDTEVFVELTLIVSNNVSFKIIGSSILCLHYCCHRSYGLYVSPFLSSALLRSTVVLDWQTQTRDIFE